MSVRLGSTWPSSKARSGWRWALRLTDGSRTGVARETLAMRSGGAWCACLALPLVLGWAEACRGGRRLGQAGRSAGSDWKLGSGTATASMHLVTKERAQDHAQAHASLLLAVGSGQARQCVLLCSVLGAWQTRKTAAYSRD